MFFLRVAMQSLRSVSGWQSVPFFHSLPLWTTTSHCHCQL